MTAAGVGVRFKRTDVVSDFGSFPPVERTKLNKTFQGGIQGNLCHLVMQARPEDFKMEKVLFPSPIKLKVLWKKKTSRLELVNYPLWAPPLADSTSSWIFR